MNSRRFVVVALGVVVFGTACRMTADHGHSQDGDAGAVHDTVSAEQAAEDVIAAHDAFVRAYEGHDVEALMSLLEADRGVLLFHPRLFDRFDDPEEMRHGLEAMFERLGETEWSDAHPAVNVAGEVAWFTSHVLIEADSMEPPFVGRVTEIWLRTDGDWRLAHAHWSEDPES